MVSSKFARSKHAFRVPDVCKKKKEAAAEAAIPYPPPHMFYAYNVDIVYTYRHYVFSGVIDMPYYYQIGPGTQWQDPSPPLPHPETAWLFHNSFTGVWTAYLQHKPGIFVLVAARNEDNITNSPPNFEPGSFRMGFPPTYTGTMDGQIFPGL